MPRRVLVVLASIAVAVPMVVSPASADERVGGPIPSRVYRGSVTTTIDYYDFCGPGFGRRFLGRESYQAGVIVTVGRTLTDGQRVENNPLRLRIEGRATRFGPSLISSSVVRTPFTGRRHLLVYWGLRRQGPQLTGTLANTHASEGAAANQLRAYGPPSTVGAGCGVGIGWVYELGAGATLSGGLTATSANLTIRGQSRDGLRVFTSRVQSSR
jgi:hypothetical protein